jgi:hypothetical protein
MIAAGTKDARWAKPDGHDDRIDFAQDTGSISPGRQVFLNQGSSGP